MIREFSQAQSAKLDYGFLYSDWLVDGDTISTSVWQVPSALTQSSPTINSSPIVRCGKSHPANTATSLFLTGGVVGMRYIIDNTITTLQGRIEVRRLRLIITEPQSL